MLEKCKFKKSTNFMVPSSTQIGKKNYPSYSEFRLRNKIETVKELLKMAQRYFPKICMLAF